LHTFAYERTINSMNITFRPHHFLCTLCFQGKGYSPTFVENYQKIVEQLNSATGDLTPISIIAHTDSICAPCPHKQNTQCASQEKITRLDNAHAEALGIKTGDIIYWGEAKKLIAEKITLEQFHQMCGACSWKNLGICEQVLRNFL
jgi:uncharacterized protein